MAALWQAGTNKAALPNEAALRWDLQLDGSSNGRVPVFAAVAIQFRKPQN